MMVGSRACQDGGEVMGAGFTLLAWSKAPQTRDWLLKTGCVASQAVTEIQAAASRPDGAREA
jgi:hypothetical protein